jgi:hypothetical protein
MGRVVETDSKAGVFREHSYYTGGDEQLFTRCGLPIAGWPYVGPSTNRPPAKSVIICRACQAREMPEPGCQPRKWLCQGGAWPMRWNYQEAGGPGQSPQPFRGVPGELEPAPVQRILGVAEIFERMRRDIFEDVEVETRIHWDDATMVVTPRRRRDDLTEEAPPRPLAEEARLREYGRRDEGMQAQLFEHLRGAMPLVMRVADVPPPEETPDVECSVCRLRFWSGDAPPGNTVICRTCARAQPHDPLRDDVPY